MKEAKLSMIKTTEDEIEALKTKTNELEHNTLALFVWCFFLTIGIFLLSIKVCFAYTFQDTFESGNLSSWTTEDSGGTSSASTTIKYGGSYAYKSTLTSGSTGRARIYKTGLNTSSIYLHFMLYLDASTSNTYFVTLFQSGGTYIGEIGLDSNGKLYTYFDGGISNGQASTALSTGTWHSIEAYININDSTGKVVLWVDGSQIISVSGDTRVSGNLDDLRMGLNHDGSYTPSKTLYMDNITYDPNPIGARNDMFKMF